MAETLENFPPGPLDFYREKASFDWKKLKLFLYGEDAIRYMHNLHEELKRYPEFLPVTEPLSFDEERYRTFKQAAIIRANKKLHSPEFIRFVHFSQSASIKYGLTIAMFNGVVTRMGSERHGKFLEELDQGKISGCFCLTEVGHGSNVKGMRTRATYDKASREFVLHTPDFQAAKCWIGGLGNSATHALLYAQLYIDEKNYGLHTFVVPIRDHQTLIPYPGVKVGDMGEKIALNGVDNGFLLFNNYRIPRENLLNKNGDVTEDGRYVTPIKDDNRRFGATLLSLSATRVGVITSTELNGGHALTIAVRYAGVRRQFGPDHNDEIPILEYQTHQYRLLPHLAAVYVLKVFGRKLNGFFDKFLQRPEEVDDLEFLGMELHIITAAAKPVSSWIMRDAIQASRDACGGHGVLKAAGLGDVKNNHESSVTYEGENWVLIQQVANFLVKLWGSAAAGVRFSSPLKSVDFLNDALTVLERGRFSPTSIDEVRQPQSLLETYQWLIAYLLKKTYDRREGLKEAGADAFSAKNNSQVFYAVRLGIAYIEHFFLQQFLQKATDCTDPSLKPLLLKLFSLYALYSLEKFLSVLYQGGYASGEQPAVLVQDGILQLCSELKNDAVALVDVIAPPDFILNSVLGASDGQVYHRLEQSFLASPYGVGRPLWWNDIVNWRNTVPKPASKL